MEDEMILIFFFEKICWTYWKLRETIDSEGYKIKKGNAEIEVVQAKMFGKEELPVYSMEIWVLVE